MDPGADCAPQNSLGGPAVSEFAISGRQSCVSGFTLIQCSSFLSPALGGAALVIWEIRLVNEQHVCTAQFGEPATPEDCSLEEIK